MDTHQKDPSFSHDRLEHYLKLLLENPNQWVKIRKLTSPWNKKHHTAERSQLMRQIENTLNLMSISFEREANFKIRIIERIYIGCDLAKHPITVNALYGLQIRGMKPKLFIIDDAEKPCLSPHQKPSKHKESPAS